MKLWEWSVKAAKGQPSSGKGDFWAVFFILEAVVRSPVCVSRRIRHSTSLCAAVCEWSAKLPSETLHVSRHRSTAGFHPPCYPNVCWESCLPFSPSCSPVGEAAERFWLHPCHQCIWCTVKSLRYCNHTLYYVILYIWTFCCCFSSTLNHLIAKPASLKCCWWQVEKASTLPP